MNVPSLRAARKRRPVPPPLPGRRARTPRFLEHRHMAGFQNLLFAARTIVEGLYAGRHASPLKGGSPEFVEYRRHDPADPVHAIDWKAFARTDRYYVRLTEKETDMNCHVLLDCSGSMAFTGLQRRPDALSKFDYACYLAAALAYLVIRQGDKAGLTLFDAAIRAHFRCHGTFPHLYAMLAELERNAPADTTGLSDALLRTAALVRRRALLVVISDFYGEADEILRALSLYRHRQFEVILFHVLHEDERRLPDVGPARLVDLETREPMTCSPADLRESYNAQVEAFIAALRSGAAARRIDYHLVTTATPYHQALRHYLVKRSRVGP